MLSFTTVYDRSASRVESWILRIPLHTWKGKNKKDKIYKHARDICFKLSEQWDSLSSGKSCGVER